MTHFYGLNFDNLLYQLSSGNFATKATFSYPEDWIRPIKDITSPYGRRLSPLTNIRVLKLTFEIALSLEITSS